jgi:hypothetical protein
MNYPVGAGIPSGIFRFVAVFIFGVYNADAGDIYSLLLQGNDSIQRPPFNHKIIRGQQIAAKWVGAQSPFSLTYLQRLLSLHV